MLKKVQVIILPAKEETQSYITLLHGKLYLNDKLHGYDTIQKTQHLYFLSDEEPKEGDWYLVKINYGSGGKYVDKSLARLNKGEKKEAIRLGAKKIIATTDRSLQDFNFDPEKQLGNYLPKPSQLFLEVFVKEYNKGNVIKEVMVEYEEYELCITCNKQGLRHCAYPEECNSSQTLNKLKVNSKDNTITIKRVKDNWNREEVIKLLKQIAHDSSILEWKSHEQADTWIKQNL